LILDDSQGPTATHGGSLSLPVGAWAYLFHLATMASPNEMRQCLELLSTRTSVLGVWESTSAIEQLSPPEKKAHVSFARHIVQVLEMPLPSGHEGAERSGIAKLGEWPDLRRRAELFLEKTHRRKS